ncbi:MAG: hypothetical protein J6C97_05610, partial [Clostridia bacterium]|nr:hypothetical protein [Clostridia bacterium]
GKLVDTFTNPERKKSTAEWGTEDWISEGIFFGDNGSQKIYLSAGVHRIYVDINGDGFNMHNIIFSYGKQANQVIDRTNSDIEVRNYTEVTGSVRVEGNHIASLHNGTATYLITVKEEGTYGLSYLLNIPGVNESYGNFTLSIDGKVVDTFTNPNKVTTGTDWVTFKWFNGDNGEQQVYLTEGEHTILFSSSVQEYNLQSIKIRYVSSKLHEDYPQDTKIVNGASIWADKDGQNGKIKFSITSTEQQGLKYVAIVVETSKFNNDLNLSNYAEYNAKKLDCEYANGRYYVQFDVKEIDYATSYTVVFFAQTDGLVCYCQDLLVSDSRSCQQVAQNLIAKNSYSEVELGYYLSK